LIKDGAVHNIPLLIVVVVVVVVVVIVVSPCFLTSTYVVEHLFTRNIIIVTPYSLHHPHSLSM
jgi:hypothetical protein